jgi:hypothetical protein
MCSKKKATAAGIAWLLCTNLASAQTPPPAQQPARPPVAGQTVLGVAVVQMDRVISGWSVNRDILNKAVVNDKRDRIGKVDDIVVSPTPDGKMPAATFAIIGVGGFLGMGKHDVAIPMEKLKMQDNRLVLPGATKNTLKALPPFEYRRR